MIEFELRKLDAERRANQYRLKMKMIRQAQWACVGVFVAAVTLLVKCVVTIIGSL